MRIKLDNISKYYYSANAVAPALRKIKLEFDVGEFVAITGESGSGKSTLLNIISGIDTYDDGEIYINGEATSHYDAADWQEYRKNQMGFVFQNYNLIENYSALYNVESSLLIQGYGNKEAKQSAMGLLKKVGLEKQARQQAAKLSSGQKQRLSIARALAKNTDIIVADEPTGNLDSENGKQIMELFCELAKEKLILVVTHNYEEAAPYVTRKIRLHDGEVVSDTLVRRAADLSEIQPVETTEQEVVSEDKNTLSGTLQPDKKLDKKSDKKLKLNSKVAWRFTTMNITTQPGRVLLYLVFLLFSAAVSFLFLGDIYSNWDDIYTKVYDDSAFLNSDMTRIVVKKPDAGEITEEDLRNFKEIEYVITADQSGFSNDINYYSELKVDYEFVYKSYQDLGTDEKLMEVRLLNPEHFMKSVSCISEDDLSSGELSKNRDEIVLYSSDQSIIGSQKLYYFSSTNTWGENQYYCTMLTVVGLLKEESSQVYFSTELCNMLSVDLYGDSYKLSVGWDLIKQRYQSTVSFVPVIGENLTTTYDKKGNPNPEVRISVDLVLPSNVSAVGNAELGVNYKNKAREIVKEQKLTAKVLGEYNYYSACFLEVEEDMFYQLFTHESRQASLYIKDYIHMDNVLKELKSMGYDAISSYRVSAVEYDWDMVASRNMIILKAFIVLLIVSILEIIIISSIFNLRNRDFYILGSMGMNQKTMKLMNYYELLIYCAISIIVIPVVMKIVSGFGNAYLINMVKYYNIKTLGIYGILNIIVILLTAWSVNQHLGRKQKWSAYDTGR